jgi:hypothetical protein
MEARLSLPSDNVTPAMVCLAAALLALLAGNAACRSEPAPVAGPTPAEVRTCLLAGTGKRCQGDSDCGPAAARGACLFGVCHGLLVAEGRPAAAVLAARIAALPPVLRASITAELLSQWRLGGQRAGVRYALTEALGRLAVGGQDRPAPWQQLAVEALQEASRDPAEDVAATARLALARLGSLPLAAAVQADLRDGTEALRVEAAVALGDRLGRRADPVAEAALRGALSDESPVVLREVRKALARARQPSR